MNKAESRAERMDPDMKAAGWSVIEGRLIARETTGRNYGRIYACDKYLKFLHMGTEPLS